MRRPISRPYLRWFGQIVSEDKMSYEDLLPSLEPVFDDLLQRHRATTKSSDWSYADYLPLDEYQADPNRQPHLSPDAYLAVETALLTEVNLPWYTVALYESFGGSLGAIRDFVHLWTAEEDQHASLLETFLLLRGDGDPVARGAIRKAIITGGWSHTIAGTFSGIVYTAFQEMQTRAYYNETAKVCDREDAMLARALRRISMDETLHMSFYRDVVKAHLERDPDYVLPLATILMNFEMPGTVIPDYPTRHEDLSRIVFGPDHYHRDVLEVLCNYWGVDDLEPVSSEAREAHANLNKYRRVVGRLGSRYERRRAQPAVAAAAGQSAG